MSGENIITTCMHMEVNKGKIVSVRRSLSNHPVIYVRTMQEREKIEHKVTISILQKDSNSVGMVFSFLYEKQPFYSVVEGNEVKLQKKTDVKTACLDKRCLFQWHRKTGEWGILESVAEPQKYLCIVNDKVTIGTLTQVVEFRLKSK